MEIIDFLIEEAFISITLLVLIALFIGNVIADKYKKYVDISVNEAVDLIGNDTQILDVREPKERTGGYIKDDIHIPMASVKNKLNELDKNKKILVYCRSGNRSAHICTTLTRNEFTHVYNLKGGFSAWQKANMPIVTK
jgi:rhodanese-related sulfurtransferase